MKKIILIASLLLAFTGISFAQTTPAKKEATKATTVHTKKDGTPDKRFKENKEASQAKPAATHLKKDGTPDKRYKENKTKKSGN
ncbi:MAG: hypothetical protein JST47_15420 [Bacteroidetes bacterium]|nr:hypothetical protein [Bacteroidota bacterium]